MKSCEIPVAYFNIRTYQYFEFSTAFYDQYDTFDANTLSTFRYRPTWSSSYNKPTQDSDSNYTFTVAVAGPSGLTNSQRDMYKFSIGVVSGNYTVESLIKYINDAIVRLISIGSTLADLNPNMTAKLSMIRVSDTGQYPVGYVKFTHSDQFINILPTELSYKVFGFTSYQNNQPIKQSNFDNANFAQYIENTNVNFILNSIKLKIYDRNNNLLTNNGFDWTFTLGIEYFN